jgi:hypothetical protein
MKKIPTLFQRNFDTDRLVRNEIAPGCGWVLDGEGVATEKIDGTCCLIRNGRLYKRYEWKPGKTPPADFEPAQEPDEVTGAIPGWVPVGDGPDDRWHREACRSHRVLHGANPLDGTYELIGPKVQGNPYGCSVHVLIAHGSLMAFDVPSDFDGLREYLRTRDIEGIVWWRDIGDPDCDKVKLKRRDFNLPWPIKKVSHE